MAVPGRLDLSAVGRRRSEAALIRAARQGDAGAVDELFRRHWPSAYRAAYLVVGDAGAAEDIAQEAFLKAIAALDQFDRRRPLAPWLHRIAVNRAIDHGRSRAQRFEVPVAAEPPAAGSGIPAAASGPGLSPAASDARLSPAAPDPGLSPELMAALGALPSDHRAVIVLRHLLGYTPGEIARMLELPRGTVNSRLRRGLDALERELER
jgi:RNA polymerase sigma-70 factor (ECF subfamily)